MRVESLERGISRVFLANGEYQDLLLKLDVATEKFIKAAFDKTFRKGPTVERPFDSSNPYELMLQHEGSHFYFPENGLTVFIHPSNGPFRLVWSIMSEAGVWLKVYLYVNSFLEKMTMIDSEILYVGNRSNSQIAHDLWNLKRRMDRTDEGLSFLKSC